MGSIDVEVEAFKAEDPPSRLKTFQAEVRFHDALDDAVKTQLVMAAEHICTISNTLRAGDTVILASHT